MYFLTHRNVVTLPSLQPELWQKKSSSLILIYPQDQREGLLCSQSLIPPAGFASNNIYWTLARTTTIGVLPAFDPCKNPAGWILLQLTGEETGSMKVK